MTFKDKQEKDCAATPVPNDKTAKTTPMTTASNISSRDTKRPDICKRDLPLSYTQIVSSA